MLPNKRIVTIALLSFVVLFVTALGFAGYLWFSFASAVDDMYEPLPSVRELPGPIVDSERSLPERLPDSAATSVSIVPANVAPEGAVDVSHPFSLPAEAIERLRYPDIDDKDPFLLLLLGVDERSRDRGRSDTMLLLAIHPGSKSVKVLSIPRDTRLRLPEVEREEKINHAYAYGGSALAVAAVERLLGVPIAYYVRTNMEGFQDIVDTVGGVSVDNAFAFSNEGFDFPQGTLALNGEEALAYVRMRYDDPKGDFGRNDRQRQVLRAIGGNVMDVGSAGKLPGLLSRLSEYVRTNLRRDDMIGLATGYRAAMGNVSELGLSGQGRMIDGLYYYVVSAEERERVRGLLLEQVGYAP